MTKKQTQNKHDPISESESDRSSSDGDYQSSSETETEKTSKRKREKKTSSKNSKKVDDKSRKRKRVKSCTSSPIKGFDDDIDKDISITKFERKKCKISSTVAIETKIIEVVEPGPGKKTYSFPSIVFIRRISGEKTFEFNLPLSLLPKIIEGLEYISQTDKQ